MILPLDAEGSARFRLATLPAIVTLKMMAFYDRLEERKRKDGADIGFTMVHYVLVGDSGARLGQGPDADIMINVGGDLLRAGTMLLGRDMGRLAGEDTRKEVVGHLMTEVGSRSNCPLAQELMQFTKGRFSGSRSLLRDLLNGYEDV